MKKATERARCDVHHDVGDHVWLATKHLPLRVGIHKLAAIWTGPFKIVSSLGPVAYVWYCNAVEMAAYVLCTCAY